MSIYAVLGATGQIGGSILRILAQQPDRIIHCLVRSKSKLESQCPEIYASKNVKIFVGHVNDLDSLVNCITGTKAIFLTAAASTSKPGERISQDQAHAVATVLENTRQKDETIRLPTIIFLSSAEAELEPKFSLGIPWPIRNILFATNYFVYMDLIAAEKYLSTKDWLDVVYIKPGGISHDIQRGHTVSEERQQTFISFLDVAAGLIECADDGERWSGKCVSVLSNGKARVEWSNGPNLMKGLLVYFVPWLHSFLF